MSYFAVIGRGSIGKRHLANLRELFPEDKLISISSRGHQSCTFENADLCLADIEMLTDYSLKGVVVASPATFHAHHVKALINVNAPLLIEKPITANIEQFNHLRHLLVDYTNPIAVAYCLRFLPSCQKVKETLANNILGHVYNVKCSVGQHLSTWRKDKNYQDSVSATKHLGGGVLLELSHELDYLQWLFGPLKPLFSLLRKSNELHTDVEEIADLVLITEQGCVIQLHLDFIQNPAQRYCQIIGENGRLDWNLLKNSVEFYYQGGTEIIYQDSNWDKNNMYLEMLSQFFSHQKSSSDSLATIEQAGQTVKLIEQVKISSGWDTE